MQVVFDVALPVFAIILAGYGGGRTVLGQEASSALSAFVYWFALPAVLLLSMARQPLGDIFNLNFIGAFLGSMLMVYALGWALGWLKGRADGPEVNSLQALNASFSNTGYMGIPLFLAAWGADHLLPAIIATVIMSVVMIGLAVITMEMARSHGHGLGRAFASVGKGLIKNPLIVSSLAGLAWNLTGLAVPQPVVNLCQLTGAAAGPCALFAIGVFLAGRPLELGLRHVGWMVPLKLLVHPLLAWGLIETVFPLDRFWTGATLLLAALPTGALTFVMANQYKVYVERTSQVILLSTIASVPVLSVILVVYASR
ncbi:AEC family transporter [Magnetospirillum sp. 64-120]|uniref:AEC family transporter n=1 Tax=Magnetospirillum sp. 64-120 TaxID=1895778 RepID=UPI00092B996D|nr:AEC family transporter [Magnetospirillum sp. 64-120]OJX79525.1 MAG: transporter [Magnetospirillum sp. 64-120]